MKIIFLHQNFPAQFARIAQALRAAGHDAIALIPPDNTRPSPIPTRRYAWAKPAPSGTTRAGHYAECVARGAAVAQALLALKREGYRPDIVIGHPGWGETLFVRDVWPDVALLLHAEFFHRAGLDAGFDPETARADALRQAIDVRTRSVVMLQAMTDATRGVAPTHWQADTFPPELRGKIDVIHEGIDTHAVRPDPAASVALKRQGIVLRPGDEVVTFVNRNFEHYRGFHIFMRALPAILDARPNARVVLVGGDEVSYGPKAPAGTTWRDVMLRELAGRLDMGRIHFVGKIPHERFTQLMQVSTVHVYLTYPFVLSWSVLEAMSAEALVVGSRTGPVTEVIEHERNGLLVDFFDVSGLSATVIDALAQPDRYRDLRRAARRTVVERYDLRTVCLPAWLKLVEIVAKS